MYLYVILIIILIVILIAILIAILIVILIVILIGQLSQKLENKTRKLESLKDGKVKAYPEVPRWARVSSVSNVHSGYPMYKETS